MVTDYWCAVAGVLHGQWGNTRKHYLTKGVGVYALMGLLADLWKERRGVIPQLSRGYFEAVLCDFALDFDWSTSGPLKGLGGATGAREAHEKIRAARKAAIRRARRAATPPRPRRSIALNAGRHGQQKHPTHRARIQEQIPTAGSDENRPVSRAKW